MDYVRALAKDPIARKVKLADLRHNLDARRLNGVRSGKYDLYLQAVRYLEKSGIEHFYAELSAWYQRTDRSRCKERLRDCLPLRAGGRPGAAAGLGLLLRTGHSRFDIVQESEASPAKL